MGDARYTDMAGNGLANVGQLARERWGEEEVVLVGFGSHRGTVIAGADGAYARPAREGSWEDGLLVFSGSEAGELLEERDHHATGVVYDPGFERYGNYVPTVLPRRYDAFLYLDETRALTPRGAASRKSPILSPPGSRSPASRGRRSWCALSRRRVRNRA